MATEKQMLANKQNAESSTGPATEAGKNRSRLNAVKTGLTGRLMLLSEADAPIYKTHLARFFTQHSPATDAEKDLVQTIVDTEWRLRLIAPLEAGIYATGRDKCADLVAHIQDPVEREAALVTEIYLTFKKDLRNIALQEGRLRNQVDKAVAQLEATQKERLENRQKELAQAKRCLEFSEEENFEPDFAKLGFDFSIDEFKAFQLARHAFFNFSGGQSLNFEKFLADFRAQLVELGVEAA